tara:strand:+ start:113 stop:826 length:714 start_codon:yes stop_codon:yes gene_type:complete
MRNISIIIPTYKEKENIFKLTKKILSLYPKAIIFVVDDTENLNLKNRFKSNKIKYFLRKNKKGRGSAVLYGLKKSLRYKSNSIFIEMDADFSHNPKELKRKIDFFIKNDLDLLISSRYLENSKIINWPIQRLVFSKLSNKLAQILLNVGVTDYTNGFRIYSRRSVELIVKKCGKIGDGFIVLSEILLTIKLNKFKIRELPTIFVNRRRGESSVNLKLIIQSLIGIVKLYFIKIKNKK